MNFIKCLLVFLLLYTNFCDAQLFLSPNLVPNPSFEDHYQCPTNISQINYAKYWFAEDSTGGSSDLFDTCSNVSFITNTIFYKHPRTGHAMAGIRMLGDPTYIHDYLYREYIESFTNQFILPNKRYCATFNVILHKSSIYAISNIGMYFSNKFVKGLASHLIVLNPQIKNTNGIISDTSSWTKISGVFIPTDTLKYFVIGNFDTVTNVNYIISNTSAALWNYYLIDDLSVCECSFNFKLGNDTTLCTGNSLLLNPNLQNAIYTWQDSSHATTYNVIQGGTYWLRAYFPDYNITTTDTVHINYVLSPTVNLGIDTTLCLGQTILLNANYPNCYYQWQDGSTLATYTVSQTGNYSVRVTSINSCYIIDNIYIKFINCDTNKLIMIPNIFTPNGDGFNDNFIIKDAEGWNISVEIYNRWGIKVYENTNYQNNWDGKDLSDGVYYYIIKAINKDNGIKKEYNGSVTVLR